MRKTRLRQTLRHGAVLTAILLWPAAASADVALGWYNLQWPTSMTVTAGTPTENVYGRVWADGVTNQPGQAIGIMAQVGYGPQADLPTEASWTWWNMTYNLDTGNDDEYMGTITPTQVGTFAYTTRFSGDGGLAWNYADLDGPVYDIGRGGVLTVTPEPASLALAALATAAAPLLPRRRQR